MDELPFYRVALFYWEVPFLFIHGIIITMDLKQIFTDLEEVNDLWLDRYINFINSRTQSKREERHHIIPVAFCKGNLKYLKTDKENLINLTFREHYIAHLLLSKALPKSESMAYALWMMTCRAKINNSRQFVKLRNRISTRMSETLSTLWQDPAFKKQMSEIHSSSTKKMWENPEIREKFMAYRQTETFHKNMKEKVWSNEEKMKKFQSTARTPEALEKQRRAFIKVTQSEEFKKAQSERSTLLWQDEVYREKVNKGYSSKKVSEGIKQKYEDPEYRKKMKEVTTSEEFRKKISESQKKRLSDPTVRQHQREMTLKSLNDPVVQRNKKIGYLKVKLKWIEKAMAKNTDNEKLKELLVKKESFEKELEELYDSRTKS